MFWRCSGSRCNTLASLVAKDRMPKSVFSRTYRIFLAQLQLTRESTGFAAFLTQAQLPDEFFPRLVLMLAPAFEDGPHGGASIDDGPKERSGHFPEPFLAFPTVAFAFIVLRRLDCQAHLLRNVSGLADPSLTSVVR